MRKRVIIAKSVGGTIYHSKFSDDADLVELKHEWAKGNDFVAELCDGVTDVSLALTKRGTTRNATLREIAPHGVKAVSLELVVNGLPIEVVLDFDKNEIYAAKQMPKVWNEGEEPR